MTTPGEDAPDPFADALIAARLCAIDPGLGGMILRGGGELRDAVIAELKQGLPDGAPVRRMPVHIDDDRLLGGIDLTATLASGRAVTSRGLLTEADGGAVVMPMAERMSDATAGRLAAAVDGGARLVLVALDDGVEQDERPPAALAERMAFRVDFSTPYPARGGGPLAARWTRLATSDSPVAAPLHHVANGAPPRGRRGCDDGDCSHRCSARDRLGTRCNFRPPNRQCRRLPGRPRNDLRRGRHPRGSACSSAPRHAFSRRAGTASARSATAAA